MVFIIHKERRDLTRYYIVPKEDNCKCLADNGNNFYNIDKTISDYNKLIFETEEEANKFIEMNKLEDEYKSQELWICEEEYLKYNKIAFGTYKYDGYVVGDPRLEEKSLTITNCDKIKLTAAGLDFECDISKEYIEQFDSIIINGIKFNREVN